MTSVEVTGEYDPNPLPAAPGGVPEAVQRMGSAATDELRKTVRAALTSLFDNFIRALPGALTKSARNAPTSAMRHACEELAFLLPTSSSRWMDTFIRHVDGMLIGGLVAGKASAGGGTNTEDAVALSNIELRAEGMHNELIRELDQRFEHIRQSLYLPIYSKALAPAGLSRAMQETADTLGWPAAHRRLLFEKFDELVVAELQYLYKTLIESLKRLSVVAEKAALLPPTPGAGAAGVPPPAKPSSIWTQATPVTTPVVPPKVDPNTVAMLQTFASRTDGDGYTDSSLATDLLALSDDRPLEGVTNDQRWVPLQRMTLAGQFLNEAISDPFIPAELRPQHESVRFPLVKSALTDSTLFTAVTHPLRSLVNELMLKSATSRITGSAEARRMAELLEQVLVQFDLAPDFVREAMLTAQPISEEQMQKFMVSQRTQSQQRREAVIGEAKRLVIRELERCTFARDLPPPAIKFLNASWGPLLMKQLLQYGAGHASWNAGVQTMEQLLDLLDAREPDKPATPVWEELIRAIGGRLAAEGLPIERVNEALTNLEAARQTR